MHRVALLALLLSVAYAQSNYTQTIFFSGGLPMCTQCGAKAQYACSPYGNTNSIGNWNNGTRTFKNPLPTGTYASQVIVTVYGSYGCTISGSTVVLSLSLNGNILDMHQGQSPSTCKCNTCDGGIEFSTVVANEMNDVLYGYNYDSLNVLYLQALNDAICVNRLEITVISTKNEPLVGYAQVTLTTNRRDCTQTCGVPGYCWSSYYSTYQQLYLQDPLPTGAILLATTVQAYGATYSQSSSSGNLTATLSSKMVGSTPVDYPLGICEGRTLVTSNSIYQDGWPGYLYGQSNLLNIRCDAAYTMFGTFTVQLYYYTPNSTLFNKV